MLRDKFLSIQRQMDAKIEEIRSSFSQSGSGRDLTGLIKRISNVIRHYL